MLKRRRLTTALGVISAAACFDLALPPPFQEAGAVSTIVTDRNGYWLHAFATAEGRWRFSADLDDVDPDFVAELVAIEDKRFWSHWGVDPLAVARAAFFSAKSGEIVSGASTITMQTARLLEPRARTLTSKFNEMLRALQLERRLTKRQILELYLTLAPYGGNIEGIRAASLVYFGKEPSRLTPAERALLIALPQAPESRRPDRYPDAAKEARASILEQLSALEMVDAEIAAEAKDAPAIGARIEFPRIAYHAARKLSGDAGFGESVISSTIDLARQLSAERIVAAHAESFDDGATAAAIVVDNQSMEIVALVGSSSLDVDGGWIDLTNAVRSPGSLLKPFIYALAFEDGILGPDTVIDDMPRGFGGYRPENFDRAFRGEVRVREALQHSLNVPAVAILEKVGVERFSAALKAAGARIFQKRSVNDKQSLALALGGAGVTMQDVAVLYAGLANGGVVRPLVLQSNSAETPADFQLFSTASADRINAILRGAPSLSGRAPAALSASAPVIAYKTGTSYGYRDAWAAGHADRLTIVVWAGRADGAPRPGETGRKSAAPLLFALTDALTKRAPHQYVEPLGELQTFTHVRLDVRPEEAPPTILYPAPGSEIFPGAFGGDGVVFAASGGAGGYAWYVDGIKIDDLAGDGRPVWRPSAPGFYDISVVDSSGRTAVTKIRVASLE
ncbi:MAG: penicillin-binding protein 1C [Parvularculaceae bacterium]|nr:penicillin-binding protein 1C [Parvularculaceae bacterium]